MNPDSLSGFFIYNSLVGAPLVGAHSEESQMGFIIILNISVTSIP